MGIFDNLLKKEDDILKESKPNENCVFSAYEGGHFGPSYYYYIDHINDHYHFKFGFLESDKVVNEKELYTLVNNEEFYIEFINKLKDITKDWKNEYINNSVLDGVQWDINDYENNIYISGSNEFPDDYDILCDLLEQYFNVEEYMKKINKYNIEPEENVIQFVYGVPDWNTIKSNDKMKEELDKYNIKPDENIPYEIYGVPDSSRKKQIDKEKIDSIKVHISNLHSKHIISLDKKINGTGSYEANISFTTNVKADSFVKIPLNEYNNYIDRLVDIVDSWSDEISNKMLKKSDSNISWGIRISQSDDAIMYSNVNGVPSNWNEFIDLLSEIELIFKNYIKKDNENK